MKKLPFFLILMLLNLLCQVHAQDLNASPEMIHKARCFLLSRLVPADGDKPHETRILKAVDSRVKACKTNDCIYSSYIDGIYDAFDSLKWAERCSVSVSDLEGRWVNDSGFGYYETISLQLYKKRPSAHQFIVYPKNKRIVDDGFGGWELSGCVIKAIEVESSSGRLFNPGNDITIVGFDRLNKMITILDGDYLADFISER